MRNKNGFTLFELLVTISIIAVLTAVAVVSFGGVNKKARDSRRTADLEKVRIALEAYKQINNAYPPSLTTLTTPTAYLQSIPTDPKDKTSYYSQLTNYTYVLGAAMEDLGSTNTAVFGGKYNYRVVNP